MTYLSERLPEELVYSLSNVMMPDLIPRIISKWLETAVPASLKDMDEFRRVTEAVKAFCSRLQSLKFSGFQELQEWVDDAPRVWLSKCRETALDSVRSKLAQGLGQSKEVERVETQIISRSEGRELAANGVAPQTDDDDDWGAAAWGDEGVDTKEDPNSRPDTNEDDGTDAWGWGEDDTANEQPSAPAEQPQAEAPAEDDPTEAWGWGEEDAAGATSGEPAANATSTTNRQTRELTLKETYNVSSMPEPVLALVSAILEDAASLVG